MPVLECKIWEGISIFTLDLSQKSEKQWEEINILKKNPYFFVVKYT